LQKALNTTSALMAAAEEIVLEIVPEEDALRLRVEQLSTLASVGRAHKRDGATPALMSASPATAARKQT